MGILDNDPPPSYNSVVRNQPFRGRDQPGNELPDVERTPREQKDKDCPDRARDTGTSSDSQNTSPGEDGQQQQTQHISLWDRFKKGLEDLALFVIEILD